MLDLEASLGALQPDRSLLLCYSASLTHVEFSLLHRLQSKGAGRVTLVVDPRSYAHSFAESAAVTGAGSDYSFAPLHLPSPRAAFHPKLYLLFHEAGATLFVASANLTLPGCRRNAEIVDQLHLGTDGSGDAWGMLQYADFLDRLAGLDPSLSQSVQEEIRGAAEMLREMLPGDVAEQGPEFLQETWTRWQRYQEREHERVALYALLHAVVPLIEERRNSLQGATTKTLTDSLWSGANEAEIVRAWLGSPPSEWTVGRAQEALLGKFDPTGLDEVFGLEALSRAVQHAQDRGEIAGGALLLLLLVTGHWRSIRDTVPVWARQTHLRGGGGRISLAMLTEAFDARAGEPLSRLFDWVMETCVLGQSLRIAVEKLASRAYRFFLAMGDNGYMVVRHPPDSRFYYPPRTGTAFRLMAELEMLTYPEGGGVELTGYGEAWLEEAKAVLVAEHVAPN